MSALMSTSFVVFVCSFPLGLSEVIRVIAELTLKRLRTMQTTSSSRQIGIRISNRFVGMSEQVLVLSLIHI